MGKPKNIFNSSPFVITVIVNTLYHFYVIMYSKTYFVIKCRLC
jgi:hypothetical protein